MLTSYGKVGAIVFGLVLSSIVISNEMQLSKAVSQLQQQAQIPAAKQPVFFTVSPTASPSATLVPTRPYYYSYPTRVVSPAK